MRAAVDTAMVHLPLSAMDQIAAEDPLAVRCFIQILMINLDILVRAFYEMQDPDDARRVAAALHRIGPRPDTPVPLSQADLGIIARVKRTRVNLVLKQFEAAGWLARGYRSVTVRNLPALGRFSAGGETL